MAANLKQYLTADLHKEIFELISWDSPLGAKITQSVSELLFHALEDLYRYVDLGVSEALTDGEEAPARAWITLKYQLHLAVEQIHAIYIEDEPAVYNRECSARCDRRNYAMEYHDDKSTEPITSIVIGHSRHDLCAYHLRALRSVINQALHDLEN
jgi:hypothetical protein